MSSSSKDSNPPSGDDDKYSGLTHNQPWPQIDPSLQDTFERKYCEDGATIHFDKIPKLPFWASWLGISERLRAVVVLSKVANYSTGTKRPLTAPEVDAVSEHAARFIYLFSWSQPVWLGCSIAASWAGRRAFRFPFYRPKMIRFDPYAFPFKDAPLLIGTSAATSWHALRFAAYGCVSWLPTAMVFGSISETSFQTHVVRDPRLAQSVQEMNRGRQSQMRRVLSAKNPQPTGHGSYQDSPTPQNYGNADDATQSNRSSESSSATTQVRSTSTQPAPRRMQENVPPSARSRYDDDDLDLFDNDDASPVAPSARSSGPGQGPPSSPGSSWERLRQQAKSSASDWERGDSSGQEHGWGQLRQDKTRNPTDSTPKTDSYSYSSDDEKREGRNYEKEQAQKEFDALLEAERRGDSSSRSWRK
ncbi:hypothetical protein F4825DRAFT_451578 [Nemania diffusa]|nr:hypothetical protein F4825DRAFT_451578 [Nemania diffusa]